MSYGSGSSGQKSLPDTVYGGYQSQVYDMQTDMMREHPAVQHFKSVTPTTVYIATAYRQKDRAAKLRDMLQAAGFVVVSSWIDADENPSEQEKHNDKRAKRDLMDINAARVLVNIAVPEGESFHGGRFFEMGYAHAQGRMVATIGRKENVFAHLPNVAFFDDERQFVSFLTGIRSWNLL